MSNDNKKKRFIDANTSKRVHEHLKDEADSISDEDIKGVTTDVTKLPGVESSAPGMDKESPKKKKEENEKDDSSQDPGIESTWNILG